MSAPSHNRRPKDEEPIDFWKHMWELSPKQFKNARILASLRVHELAPTKTSHALSAMVPHLQLTVIVQARSVKLGLLHVHSSYYLTFLKSLHAGLRVAVQICAANSPELTQVHWLEETFPWDKYPSGVLNSEIEGFEISPIGQSLVLASNHVLSKPRASVVLPSAPSATLAPSSSASRPPAKKDKKKPKEDKHRDSERKPRSGDDNSDGLDLVTPAADVPREAAKAKTVEMPLSDFPAESAVRRQKATGARPQSLPTPKMMPRVFSRPSIPLIHPGSNSLFYTANYNAPAVAHMKKRSRQAASKTPAIIEDSDGDIVEELPPPKPMGKDKKKASAHPTTGGKKLPSVATKKNNDPSSKTAKPSPRILRRDEAIPVVRTISPIQHLAERLQLQSKPQHADSWELDNPIFPKAKMADVIAVLPKYNKERLPLDKEGVYFTLAFGDLMDLLAVTPAVDGLAAPPASTAEASATRCNLAFSDELNNNLTTDLKSWVEISSRNWRDQMRELTASSHQVEMVDRARQLALNNHHYNMLRLLHAIVCARRSITRQEFVARFAGESPETQDFNALCGHYYRPMDLVKPIPAFSSAYDFYDTLEDAANPQRPLGFYMIPANLEANIPPVWVPLEVSPPAMPVVMFTPDPVLPAVNPVQLMQLDAYAAAVPDVFQRILTFNIDLEEDDTIQLLLQTHDDIHVIFSLIQDCLHHNRLQCLAGLIRERLDIVTFNQKRSLPDTMLI
ncbi:hypothetical protein K438DRAFT_1992563 [Mycena galopus ATCC 62051]|nr:hypothetical protein K438DRAFT_1992563 [Mycena galopus ATCC 62051]